jgi:hypothetical protein
VILYFRPFYLILYVNSNSICKHGRTIAEAVSRWLPTAAAWVQSRVWSSGICGGQSGVWAGFLRVLRFPLPFIPPNFPFSQSPGAGTIGQLVADVPSGPSLDSSPPLWKLKKKSVNIMNSSYFCLFQMEVHDPI